MSSHRIQAGSERPAAGDGIVPGLAELVALRASALGRGQARRARFGVVGQAASAMRGRGMEYAESREYAYGDDARHIDWRLSARSGKPHTKLFQAERARLSLIVADTAAAMYFGTRVRFKSVQAARAGAVAAWRAVGVGDRVAALRGSQREAAVAPGAGAHAALRVLDALARWYARPPADDAGLALALEHAQRLLRPGSRLLALAEPASIATVPARRWSALTRHADVLVLLLADPLEQQPPRARLAFAPTVGGAVRSRCWLDLRDTGCRARWRQAFGVPIEAALGRLPAAGVRACLLSTDAASDSWLEQPHSFGGAGRC